MKTWPKLAALLALLLAAPLARADYYGKSNRPHGHTTATDGGLLGNVSITGNLTAAGVLSAAYPILIARDEKSLGTDGGTFTAGAWQQRNLNALQVNTITGASLTSNQITLPAGTYRVEWSAPAYVVNGHQSVFTSTPTATVSIPGNSARTNSTVFMTTDSGASAVFTIAAPTIFEVQHRCATTKPTDGLGVAFGNTTEVYTTVEIWKIK